MQNYSYLKTLFYVAKVLYITKEWTNGFYLESLYIREFYI